MRRRGEASAAAALCALDSVLNSRPKCVNMPKPLVPSISRGSVYVCGSDLFHFNSCTCVFFSIKYEFI